MLAGIGFVVDGGDRHPNLDKLKDGRFEAKDIRVRFELGGAAGAGRLAPPASLTQPVALQFDNVHVGFTVLRAAFGDGRPRWESGRDGGKSWLDLVLLSGEPRKVDLQATAHAAVGLALRIDAKRAGFEALSARAANDVLELSWAALGVDIPVRPAKSQQLAKHCHMRR